MSEHAMRWEDEPDDEGWDDDEDPDELDFDEDVDELEFDEDVDELDFEDEDDDPDLDEDDLDLEDDLGGDEESWGGDEAMDEDDAEEGDLDADDLEDDELAAFGVDLEDDLELDAEGPELAGSVDVFCPYCGAEVEMVVDPVGGDQQEYVEDCEVCCQPWSVRVTLDPEGFATVDVTTLDEG